MFSVNTTQGIKIRGDALINYSLSNDLEATIYRLMIMILKRRHYYLLHADCNQLADILWNIARIIYNQRMFSWNFTEVNGLPTGSTDLVRL
jgi:hypothetical protein